MLVLAFKTAHFMSATFLIIMQIISFNLPIKSLVLGAALKKDVTLVWMGDSFVLTPVCKYGTLNEFKRLLPEYNLKVHIIAGYGAQADNLQRQIDMALPLGPDIILLHTDSDVSQDKEKGLNSNRIGMVRRAYYDNMTSAIDQMLIKNNISMIFGGPGIMGEGPLLAPKRFKGKNRLAETYQDINYQIMDNFLNYTTRPGSRTAIAYVNIHDEYMHALSTWWKTNGFYRCVVTEDGEHPDQKGSDMLGKAYADAFRTVMTQIAPYLPRYPAITAKNLPERQPECRKETLRIDDCGPLFDIFCIALPIVFALALLLRARARRIVGHAVLYVLKATVWVKTLEQDKKSTASYCPLLSSPSKI